VGLGDDSREGRLKLLLVALGLRKDLAVFQGGSCRFSVSA
jgi:hypothetical protein